ncbi:Hypothetical protein ORPV_621 [Orpheovirus IHUMI-LCC2]|uniref:Uncharacterized protein n=1 Tax=Orpheovirus IHUMI-LCC2 TaxID=2023057 RepID=A0A2I2L4P5_9VIRU|nr:Hypothetical protein ORPV_621 [Orpheovirus IHUMI-LCC2]SNW62525.1 Hypothetical protein ORPV_621 [Orpheovirus IHUMI-LCC2]
MYNKLEDIYHKYKDEMLNKENISALLIECRSAYERMLAHIWANSKGMKHSACIYNDFAENSLFICKECKRGRYQEDIDMIEDYSTISGSIYGYYWRCKKCDSVHISEYPEEERTYIVKDFYNCVAVGFNLPEKIGNKVETDRTKKNKYIVNRRKNEEVKDLSNEINSTFRHINIKHIILTEEEKDKINGLHIIE